MKTAVRKLNNAIRVLLILLIILLPSVGCGGSGFETGADVLPLTGTGDMLMLLKSDKDTFPMGDITLDLYYGLYDFDELEEDYHGDLEDMYRRYDGIKSMPFFCIYIHPSSKTYWEDFVQDYKSIENYYLIKEIHGDFSRKEYGYDIGFLYSISYNHKEQIKIPKEAFESGQGCIEVEMVAIYNLREEGVECYYMGEYYSTSIFYEIKDNKIHLGFRRKK